MPLVAGPPAFITLKDIIFANDATNVYVRCETDQACRLRYRMWRERTPEVVYEETENPAGIGKRYQTLPRTGLGAGVDASGETIFIELAVPVPPNPATPYMRSYLGTHRITGGRSVAKKTAVTPEFYGFTTTTPTSLNYTWSQYNPDQQASVPNLLVGKPWVTISNVRAVPSATGVVIEFATDVAAMIFIRWWPLDEATGTGAIVGDAEVPLNPGPNKIPITVGAGHAGKHYGFEIYEDTLDVGLRTRPYTGSFQLLGARDATDVPVRFYSHSGPMTAPVPAPKVQGNWNTYAWSQYNPKGT